MSVDVIKGPETSLLGNRKRSANDGITEQSEEELDMPKKKNDKKRNSHPKFRLRGTTGEQASLETSINDRVPLTLSDVQHLLLHSLLGNINLSQPPRWYVLEKCHLISQTACLVFEGISIDQWEKYNSKFVSTKKCFDNFVEILTPSAYNGSLVDELALVPISEADRLDLIQKYGSMNLAVEARKDLNVMMKAVFPITSEKNNEELLITEDKFPRTQLILSAWQLIEENYPLPLKGKLKQTYTDYVMTKHAYEPVTEKSPMFGLDCEMCMTNAGSELTRVSIVNEKYETVYDSFVKPYNNITDYLTKFSGISKTTLENVTKRLEDVQNDIKELLPKDAILVGQSLNIDLHALKMMHPYVIDTSCIFSFTGERTRKPKLKTLVKELLNEDIQQSKSGHCSIEDSKASLKLVQLKLSKFLEFGDAVHTNRQKFKENYLKLVTKQEYALTIFNHMIDQKKTSIVIGCDDITGDYHTYMTQAKESLTNQFKKGKVKRIKLSTVDNVDEVIDTFCESSKTYNLTMAHLKIECNEDQSATELDNKIEKVWKSLSPRTLFVVLFGGSDTNNGIAMGAVKT